MQSNDDNAYRVPEDYEAQEYVPANLEDIEYPDEYSPLPEEEDPWDDGFDDFEE